MQSPDVLANATLIRRWETFSREGKALSPFSCLEGMGRGAPGILQFLLNRLFHQEGPELPQPWLWIKGIPGEPSQPCTSFALGAVISCIAGYTASRCSYGPFRPDGAQKPWQVGLGWVSVHLSGWNGGATVSNPHFFPSRLSHLKGFGSCPQSWVWINPLVKLAGEPQFCFGCS